LLLPLYFRLFYLVVTPAFFVYWGIREGRRKPKHRNTSLTLGMLLGATIATAIISYGTTSALFRGDIIYSVLFFSTANALLFWGARNLFNAHRESMADWFQVEETASGYQLRVRQGTGRRAKRFFTLLGLTVLSAVCAVVGMNSGLGAMTLLGVLGFLVCAFATAFGVFPYVSSLTTQSVVTLEATQTAFEFGENTASSIPFAEVTEIVVRSANDESFAVSPKRTERDIFVGGTGATGTAFAAASVVGAGTKAVGEIAGQSALIGIHIVRSGSDFSVEIAHAGSRSVVAAFLSKDEAQYLAQYLADLSVPKAA
jgi:hypothetical protein